MPYASVLTRRTRRASLEDFRGNSADEVVTGPAASAPAAAAALEQLSIIAPVQVHRPLQKLAQSSAIAFAPAPSGRYGPRTRHGRLMPRERLGAPLSLACLLLRARGPARAHESPLRCSQA